MCGIHVSEDGYGRPHGASGKLKLLPLRSSVGYMSGMRCGRDASGGTECPDAADT